jgi:phospho-N-acetylmuramoyl-pentapeptide-transferase
MCLTPLWTSFLYKKKLGKQIRAEEAAPIFFALHKEKSGTPTMGGVIIWATVLILAVAVFYLAKFFPNSILNELNFLSRSQTWLPLAALIGAAIIGLVDDYLNVRRIGPFGGGLAFRLKFWLYLAIALVGAYWFYFKLDWTILHVPFVGNFDIGIWYIPFFLFMIVATSFSVNQIDGLDGLAGGTLLTAFGAYAVIAFNQGKFDLAAFCGVIVGGLLAFLWFNINPARFFMGDTGAMALGVTLGIVSMLTNSALLMPVIGFLFLVEALSTIIQILSKKIRHKKVFLSAPIHHHLQAKGWSEPKIVMRFWVISGVVAVAGIVLHLLDTL